MISTSRGILLELQRGNASGRPAGVLRSVYHERLGLRATGRALASRAGMLAESGRDGLTTRLRIVPLELGSVLHVSPRARK